MSIVTVYKNGEQVRLHEIDADAWIAQGWSLDPSSAATTQIEPALNPDPAPQPKRKIAKDNVKPIALSSDRTGQ